MAYLAANHALPHHEVYADVRGKRDADARQHHALRAAPLLPRLNAASLRIQPSRSPPGASHDHHVHHRPRVDQHRGPRGRHRRHHACMRRTRWATWSSSTCPKSASTLQEGRGRRRRRVGQGRGRPVHAGRAARSSRSTKRCAPTRRWPTRDPLGNGWFFKVHVTDMAEFDAADGRARLRRCSSRTLIDPSTAHPQEPTMLMSALPAARASSRTPPNSSPATSASRPTTKRHMLSVIGAASRRALIDGIVPRSHRARRSRWSCRRR